MKTKPKCGHTSLRRSCDDCNELQDSWYEKANEEGSGYEDIEDRDGNLSYWRNGNQFSLEVMRPGKGYWTSVVDLEVVQQPHLPVTSLFPTAIFHQEQEFLHSNRFEEACESLVTVKLPLKHIKRIWEDYCNGVTSRVTAPKLKVSHVLVHQVIHKLTNRMDVMDYDQAEAAKPVKVVVRSIAPSDEAFIYASWRNSLWYDHSRPEENAEQFYKLATKAIKAFLTEPTMKVRVAVEEKAPTFILGYALVQGSTLVWTYVKADYRNQGIARLLAKGCTQVFTPMTKTGKAIVADKGLTEQKAIVTGRGRLSGE